MFRSLLLIALVLAVSNLAIADPIIRKPFDRSRSFDHDYAMRFIDSLSTLKLLSEAAFAQFFTGDPVVKLKNNTRRKIGDPVPTLPKQTIKEEFCGCSFYRNGDLSDPVHCRAMEGINDESLATMSTIKLIDLDRLAEPLACYRQGSPLCTDNRGVQLGGSACCKQVDSGLRAALHDPYFYALAPTAIVSQLDGLIPGAARAGSPEICGVAIDRENGVYSLPARFNGMVARAWLHAFLHYGTLGPVTKDQLAAYSSSSPATVFEIARERMIRLRFAVGETFYSSALAAFPISPGFRELGAIE